MRIHWLQTDIIWKDRLANHAHVSHLLEQIQPNEVDMVVLPEMWNSGFCMEPADLAESHEGETWSWCLKQAQRLNALVLGSWVTTDSGLFYNRLHVAFPDGRHLHYNKRHLFAYAGEDQHYASGHEILDFVWKGFTIRPLVCFDLRFPVWSRTTSTDLLIYVANWPEARITAWDQLLAARAIENQCFVLGVNRTGIDGYGITYVGHSALYQFDGKQLHYSEKANDQVSFVLLKEELDKFKTRFPFHLSADSFTLNS